MLFGPDNFLTNVRQLVVGGGRRGDAPLHDSGFLVDTQLAADAVAAASGTALPAMTFKVPRDYDEATDEISFTFTGRMDGATDTPAVTAVIVRSRVGESDVTIANGVSVISNLSTVIQSGTILLTGNELQRGDVLNIVVTSGAHTTDDIERVTGSVSYRSTLVSYDRTDSDGVQLR